MKLNLSYKKSDWHEFQSFLVKRVCKESKSWYDSTWFNIVVWFITSIIFFTYFQSTNEFNWATAGIVSIFFIFIYAQTILSNIKLRKAMEPSAHGSFIGEHHFEFTESGVKSEGKGYSSFHEWGVFNEVVVSESAIYLFMDSFYAFIFPSGQLENAREILALLEGKVKNVTKHSI